MATAASENGKALVLTSKNIVSFFSQDSIVARIKPFMPEGVDAERVVASVKMAVDNTPALLDCTPQSLVMAVARIQQWGLEIGTTAHLVPFGKTCTPVADYKGLAELMVASGAVRGVQARPVYEGDLFEYEYGLNARLVHRPAPQSSRGAITHAYCILDLPFNRQMFEVMTAEEIEEIRQKHSKQWKNGRLPGWYAAKSVVRRISKLVPKNPRLAKVLAVLKEDAIQEGPEVAAAFSMVEDDDKPQLATGEPAEMGAEWELEPEDGK